MGRPQKPLKLHILQRTNQPCGMKKRAGELDLPAVMGIPAKPNAKSGMNPNGISGMIPNTVGA